MPAIIPVTVPGEGVAPGTLRSAILAANASPGSTIVFNINDTVLLTSSLTITAPTTINATGRIVIIDGGNFVRDFVIVGSNNVVFIGDANYLTNGNTFTIRNGFAALGNGGGISASSPNAAIALHNMLILNNTATTAGTNTTGNGGGVYSAGSLGIYNSTVDGNSASFFGGGAYAGKQLNIDSSILSDNTALNGAGVYEATTSPVVISGTSRFSQFLHNTTTTGVGGGNGAGVWAFYNITVNFTLFDNNVATASGGGIYSLNGNVTLNIGTTLTNNLAATGNGGGVFAFRNVVVTGVVIADNRAFILGGGICSFLGSVTVGGTIPAVPDAVPLVAPSLIGYTSPSGVNHGNTAQFGGGIHAGKDVFIGSLSGVGGNTATVEGGGIWAQGNITIDPAYVNGNVSLGNGGGIATGPSPQSTVTIISSFVYSNIASVHGGGIYTPNGNIVTVQSAIFSNRAGQAGGGLYDGAGSVQLFRSTVIDSNIAGIGGGIFLGSGADLQTGSVFGAPAPVLPAQPAGSALFSYTGELNTFSNTVIISFNLSSSTGGGIDAEFANGVTLVNTWVANNTSSSSSGQGGGMFARAVPNVSISYSTFSANLAKSAQGGGLAVVGGGGDGVNNFGVHVDDSTFGANTATFGAGVFLQGVQGYFNHVTFNDNHLSTLAGSGAAIYADFGADAFIENVLADDTNGVAGGNLLGFAPGGSIQSMGHNFSSDNSLIAVTNYNPANGDKSFAVQGLTPLAFHGGATPTYNLLAGGAAIGAGDTLGPPLDQNNVFRPLFGLPSDIGSVQF